MNLNLLYISLLLILIQTCSYKPKHENQPPNVLFKTDTNSVSKGRHTISNGEFRTLFVFVDFKDNDTLNAPGWQWNNNVLPKWAKSIVNNSTELSFPSPNLTDYFYQMSNGKFFFYGDVHPEVIILKNKQSKYKSIKDVNDEIVQRIDSTVDFSKYDNWSKDKDGVYKNKPDGKVDAIFLVYRDFEDRLFFYNKWTGIAHLYLTKDYYTNDGVKISSGRLDKGSGIQTRGGKAGYNYIKYVLAHEFGHLLFGTGHIENVTNLALMTGGPVWNASRGMHSWERNKLGWIDFIDVPTSKNSTFEIDDFATTGDALRIRLSSDEWFIIENHQKISNHDWAKDKGIFIYKVTNAQSSLPKITVQCADGNWDFEIDEKNEILTKTTPNRNGKSELNFTKKVNRKRYACYKQVYEDKSAWGDKNDAFDLTYNNLFSPVSNPSSINSTKIKFAIGVSENNGTKYVINIFFKDIYKNTPPSKPQIIELKKKENNLQLVWLRNEEPDLAGYNIYHTSINGNIVKDFIDLDRTSIEITKLLNPKISNEFSLTSIDSDKNESVKNSFSVKRKDKNWVLYRME